MPHYFYCSMSFLIFFLGYKNDVIILLDKLNTHGNFMWYLMENIDGGATNAKRNRTSGDKI